MKIISTILLLSFSVSATAINLNNTEIDYSVCFTPGGSCTSDIVDEIDSAKRQVLIQAYQLTSYPIIDAILAAKKRGVDVDAILDKSQRKARKWQQYSAAQSLSLAGIPVYIDNRVSIAHNKVIIIDDRIVITGSFNFSYGAQHKNAENLLILDSSKIAVDYKNNWFNRKSSSIEYNQ